MIIIVIWRGRIIQSFQLTTIYMIINLLFWHLRFKFFDMLCFFNFSIINLLTIYLFVRSDVQTIYILFLSTSSILLGLMKLRFLIKSLSSNCFTTLFQFETFWRINFRSCELVLFHRIKQIFTVPVHFVRVFIVFNFKLYVLIYCFYNSNYQ